MRNNRFLILLLALVLCLSCSVTALAAEEQGLSISLTTDKTSLEPGSTFVVSVMLDANPGNLGVNFDIKWDSDVMELVRVDQSKAAFKNTEANQANNRVIVTLGNPLLGITSPGEAQKIEGTGKVLEITFKSTQSGESGGKIFLDRTSYVTLTDGASDNVMIQNLSMQFVKAGHVHTPGPATCSEEQTCTACKVVLGPKLEHTLETVPAQAPTCGEFGWESYEKCKNCSYSTMVQIKATGTHTFGDWKTIEETTDESVGTQKRMCTVCQIAEYRDIPADYEEPVQNPTTGETGADQDPQNKQPSGSIAPAFLILGILVAALVAVLVLRKKRVTVDEETP